MINRDQRDWFPAQLLITDEMALVRELVEQRKYLKKDRLCIQGNEVKFKS